MTNKPEQIDTILYNNKFADCWTVGIKYDDWNYETLTCSDSPSYPQGVFSSNEGRYFDENNNEYSIKKWEDLPETLQNFLIDYLGLYINL